MDAALILVRAIHFAATALVAGTTLFGAVIAEPAFATDDRTKMLADQVRHRLAVLFWVALAVAIGSGAAWLILLAEEISGGSLSAVFLDRIVWIVLTRTDFGTGVRYMQFTEAVARSSRHQLPVDLPLREFSNPSL